MDQHLSGRKRLWGYRSLQRLYFTLQMWKKYTHTGILPHTPRRQTGNARREINFKGGRAEEEKTNWSCLMLKQFHSSWYVSAMVRTMMYLLNVVSCRLMVFNCPPLDLTASVLPLVAAARHDHLKLLWRFLKELDLLQPWNKNHLKQEELKIYWDKCPCQSHTWDHKN